MAAPLACRVEDGADAAHIADAIFTIWGEIDDALTPIIGPQGVVALFRRCLHLTAVAHPWVTAPHEGTPSSMDPTALKTAFARQSSAVAAAGGNAFLHTFHGLLASLVGSSLTERLLRCVWTNSSGGPTAKDISA